MLYESDLGQVDWPGLFETLIADDHRLPANDRLAVSIALRYFQCSYSNPKAAAACLGSHTC